jgi:phospholipid/cholesterol/gamma-HCH transport system permease protein
VPQSASPQTARIESHGDAERLVIALGGRLASETTGAVWREAMAQLQARRPAELVVDASGLDYCDVTGASLLLALRRNQEAREGHFELQGLRQDFGQLLDLIRPGEAAAPAEAGRPPGFFERLGRAGFALWGEVHELIVFTGHLVVVSLQVARRPRLLRFADAMSLAERAGIGAVPIIALVGFLLGLILAFQSVIPMQRFGAEIYVADILGIAMFRELGPLMTAILLTARSGSAFAAEIGTMKVNEEIDALTTMGLEPVRFLIVPRALAAVTVVPVLTMIMTLSSLVGGAIVFVSMNYPLVTYVNRIVSATAVSDLVGGLLKSFVLGVIVAGVGCLRGLQTGKGAQAVGISTTSSVVSGIILIAITEGIFAVIFFVVGL